MGQIKDTLFDVIENWETLFIGGVAENDYDALKDLLVTIHNYQRSHDLNIWEKVTVLINECVILDKVNDTLVEHQNIDFSREKIISLMQNYYENIVSSSMINDLSDDTIIAIKEQLSYLIALLLYKVHSYENAFNYFQESRKQSVALMVSHDEYGLTYLQRLERDIRYAYCCEYLGTPQNDKNKLVQAIQALLGALPSVPSESYWENFKHYCYNNYEKISVILCGGKAINEKRDDLIKLLMTFTLDKGSVLDRIYYDHHNPDLCIEAIHVLAHCLNEINLITDLITSNNIHLVKLSEQNASEELKKINIIKVISRFLMDSLGHEYITCKATIRAEQGNGIDAFMILNDIDTSSLSEADEAELDFYKFYFESLFYNSIKSKILPGSGTLYGNKFQSYCNANIAHDPDNCKDGLLHYAIFALRKELHSFVRTILQNDDPNLTFLKEEYRIEKTNCHKFFLQIQNGFSVYVNSQVIAEREKLISVYNAIRLLQKLHLPLLFEPDADYEDKLSISSDIEELFNTCRHFNHYYSNYNKQRTRSINNCHFCTFQSECDSLPNKESKTEKESCYLLVDGLIIDVYGDVSILKQYLTEKSFLRYEIQYPDSKKTIKYHQYARRKMVLYKENEGDKLFNCCLDIYNEIRKGALHQVYYIGNPDNPDFEDFNGASIIAVKSIDICFTFAYVYATVEKIIADTINPKPIYILAPLRNTSSYRFQGAEFTHLINGATKIKKKEFNISKKGIGILFKNNKWISDCYYDVHFANDSIKNACVTIIKVKNDRLYVLRDEKTKLIRKPAHIELVKKMYQDYSSARKRQQKRRHEIEFCRDSGNKHPLPKACDYFFSIIDNEPGENTLTIRTKKAGTKLINFLQIACEEDNISSNALFLFEDAYIFEQKNDDFQLCIFKEDIIPFCSNMCLRYLVSVTEVNISGPSGGSLPPIDEHKLQNPNSEVEDNKKILIDSINKEIDTQTKFMVESEDKSTRELATKYFSVLKQLRSDVTDGTVSTVNGQEKFRKIKREIKKDDLTTRI